MWWENIWIVKQGHVSAIIKWLRKLFVSRKQRLVDINHFQSCLNYQLPCQLFSKVLMKYTNSDCEGLCETVRCSYEILTKLDSLIVYFHIP